MAGGESAWGSGLRGCFGAGQRRGRVWAAILGVGLWACDAEEPVDPVEEAHTDEEDPVDDSFRVLLGPEDGDGLLNRPFPNDASPDFPFAEHVTPFARQFAEHIGRVSNGHPRWPTFYLRLTEAPADLGPWSEGGAMVFDLDGAGCGEPIPLTATSAPTAEWGVEPVVRLALPPEVVLREGRKYGVVLGDGLVSASGASLATSRDLEEVGPFLEHLERCYGEVGRGAEGEGVAAAFTITTETPSALLGGFKEVIEERVVPEGIEVEQVDRHSWSRHRFYRFSLPTSVYLDGSHPFHFSGGAVAWEAGRPAVVREEEVVVRFLVPDDGGAGAPHPLMLSLPGTRSTPWNMVDSSFADSFGDRGLVVVTFQPLGTVGRSDESDGEPVGDSAYNTTNLQTVRTQPWQLAADAAWVLKALYELETRGEMPLEIDWGRVTVWGQSRGAMSAPLVPWLDERVGRLALSGIGSDGMTDHERRGAEGDGVSFDFFAGLLNEPNLNEESYLWSLFRWADQGSDAGMLVREDSLPRDMDLLVFNGEGDEVIPDEHLSLLAARAGLSLVEDEALGLPAFGEEHGLPTTDIVRTADSPRPIRWAWHDPVGGHSVIAGRSPTDTLVEFVAAEDPFMGFEPRWR